VAAELGLERDRSEVPPRSPEVLEMPEELVDVDARGKEGP
jgi:hypothetical protein